MMKMKVKKEYEGIKLLTKIIELLGFLKARVLVRVCVCVCLKF